MHARLLVLAMAIALFPFSVRSACFPTVRGPDVYDGNWVQCGGNGGMCLFTGEATVRYGRLSTQQWVYRANTPGPVPCDNIVFGPPERGMDPAPGFAKTCWVDKNTTEPYASTPHTANWTPPDWMDAEFGKCLSECTDCFNQEEPESTNATCASCHGGGHLGRKSMDINGANVAHGHSRRVSTIANARRIRKVPHLANVLANELLGADGRLDTVSNGGIADAIADAVNSDIEMNGVPLPFQDFAMKSRAVESFVKAISIDDGPDLTQVVPFPKGSGPNSARVAAGRACFFGEPSCAAGAALLAEGKACVSCHGGGFRFTDGVMRTNILDPDAAWDLGKVQPDGIRGPVDPVGGLTLVCDPDEPTRCVYAPLVRTPSLQHSNWIFSGFNDQPISRGPWMHDAAFMDDGNLREFYVTSLGIGKGSIPALTGEEEIGLFDYWPRFCLRGQHFHPGIMLPECFPPGLGE